MADQVNSANAQVAQTGAEGAKVGSVYATVVAPSTGANTVVGSTFAVVSSFDVSFLGDIQAMELIATVACRCDGLDYNGNPLVVQEQWSEAMIYTDIIFPQCLSYGSSMTPTYRTDKVEVLSRSEQRNSRAEFPRFSYNVNMENFEASEIAEVLRIFHVCSGDHAAFLFRDPSDSTSKVGSTWVGETDISAEDQTIGVVGGGPTTVYPLYKVYAQASRSKRRRIRHPDLATLQVALDGYIVSNWTWVEASQGVQFTVQTSPFIFTGDKAGSVITGADFTGLNVNDMVIVSGFATGSNNVAPLMPPLRVTAADATSVTLERYDGTTYSGANETNRALTLTQVSPNAGTVITAGFNFYTPVRFDGDQVNFQPRAGLRETFQGDLSVTLIEVFE